MKKLVALVAIAVGVGLERITFQPGEEVTGLNAVDVADLKACGALEDVGEAEAARAKDAKLEKAAAKEFAEARKAVQASDSAREAPLK